MRTKFVTILFLFWVGASINCFHLSPNSNESAFENNQKDNEFRIKEDVDGNSVGDGHLPKYIEDRVGDSGKQCNSHEDCNLVETQRRLVRCVENRCIFIRCKTYVDCPRATSGIRYACFEYCMTCEQTCFDSSSCIAPETCKYYGYKYYCSGCTSNP